MTSKQLLLNEFLPALSDTENESEIKSIFRNVLAHVLNLDYSETLLLNHELSEENVERCNAILSRIKNGESLHHLLGKVEFLDLNFKVNKDVLIPRPETEWIVHETIKRFESKNPRNIIDFCTGSGCIAISLKNAFKNSNVVALEKSEKAIEIALENARYNDLEIKVNQIDVLKSEYETDARFDIIISNPPYIPYKETHEIENKVLENEPKMALFVDDQEPLVFYERIIKWSENRLSSQGEIVFEINPNYAKELTTLAHQYSYKTELLKDLYNKDRMLILYR